MKKLNAACSGYLKAGESKHSLPAFHTTINELPILPLDETSARHAGQFRAMRQAAGFTAHPSDMMIARIVAAAGATLATRNTKDFAGLPIPLVNPWDYPAK